MPESPDLRDEDIDLDLVRRTRQGDIDAFGRLVDRHQHRLVNFVRLMMARVQDTASAEDVAQEAFLRAYRSIGQFRGQSSFKTWLFQIGTNVARTHMSKRRDRREEQEPETPHREVASGENVERRVIAHDQLRHALAQLPDDWREALILRDIEGFDYREIAEQLDIPMGTVESRIFRARQRLKAALEGDTP